MSSSRMCIPSPFNHLPSQNTKLATSETWILYLPGAASLAEDPHLRAADRYFICKLAFNSIPIGGVEAAGLGRWKGRARRKAIEPGGGKWRQKIRFSGQVWWFVAN